MTKLLAQTSIPSDVIWTFIVAILIVLFIAWLFAQRRLTAEEAAKAAEATAAAKREASAAAEPESAAAQPESLAVVEAAPVAIEKKEPPAVPTIPDDLQRIEGIGPKISGILHAAGISTFAVLAATSVGRLREVLDSAGITEITDPGTWPEQARLAAEGKWDELAALQEALKGGRRVD